MYDEFFKALKAKPNKKLYPYDRLLGEWNFLWNEHKNGEIIRTVKGEWLFATIMDGNAIADLFICPSREERKINPQPDQDYGLTIRYPYNDGKTWEINYYTAYGIPSTKLIGQAEGNDIIQKGVNSDNSNEIWEWDFYNITNESFDWIFKYSHDGKNFSPAITLHATRKNRKEEK